MNDSILNIKIIAFLAPLLKGEGELTSCVDELIQLDRYLKLDIKYVGNTTLNIAYYENYTPDIDLKLPYIPDAIVFEISIRNEYKDIKGHYIKEEQNRELDEIEKKGFFESVVVDDYIRKIYHLIILSQIAYPGSIILKKGLVLVNDKFNKYFIDIKNIHRDVFFEIKKIKWPVYKVVSFIQVWEWFIKNNFSFERYSSIKTERALNAFTYLFDGVSSDLVLDLLWALIGIEALYATSKEGISDQIFNKTQVLLGPITDFKKRLKQMYDFRSRLVHGDLDIPPNHYDSSDSENEAFHSKLYESTILAVAILTVTFQEMILKNKKDLDFQITLQ